MILMRLFTLRNWLDTSTLPAKHFSFDLLMTMKSKITGQRRRTVEKLGRSWNMKLISSARVTGARGVSLDCCSSGAFDFTHIVLGLLASFIKTSTHCNTALGKRKIKKCRNMLGMIIYGILLRSKQNICVSVEKHRM